jgi:hypothetical protein
MVKISLDFGECFGQQGSDLPSRLNSEWDYGKHLFL